MRELPNNVLSKEELVGNLPKKSWRRFGYYSIFAAVPAMVVSQTTGARSESPIKTEPSVGDHDRRLPRKLTPGGSPPALLKRQSAFRLPHQRDSFSTLAALSGNDDCPGYIIPGGTYTAAAPYTEAGDTTGGDNTINAFYGYYYTYEASGPDRVYSFTVTGLGSNPQIKVSATSSTYRPLIYVVDGKDSGSCPAGTGNFSSKVMWWFVSWSNNEGVATLNSETLKYLPLNVPLHLFVDGQRNDAQGSGPYKIQMQDVTIASDSCATSNPIDCPDFFIRQQYLDFLKRDPEHEGLQFYLDIINGCSAGDAECMKYTRGALSANFFRSPEFGRKGAYVANLFNIVFGQRPKVVAELNDASKVERPHYGEFMADLAELSTPNDDPGLTEQKKNQLAAAWLGRTEVQAIVPGSLSNQQFVQKLESTAGVTLANENTLIANLNNGTQTRAQVLRAIAESNEVISKFYIPNFVTMEYLGFLRRDPEDCHLSSDPANCGYIFHNSRFNTPGAHPDMIENFIVRGFIESPEYRNRFGP
jgi:hypothetical protein